VASPSRTIGARAATAQSGALQPQFRVRAGITGRSERDDMPFRSRTDFSGAHAPSGHARQPPLLEPLLDPLLEPPLVLVDVHALGSGGKDCWST
jgi:hypothetical protein